MDPTGRPQAEMLLPVRLEVLAYAPTEFFHCQHCEVAWQGIGLGSKIRAEQRSSGLLPPDLLAEYEAISEWLADARTRYGERLQLSLVDAASIEGFFKALWHRARHFPAFVVDGHVTVGFEPHRLNATLEERLGPAHRVDQGRTPIS